MNSKNNALETRIKKKVESNIKRNATDNANKNSISLVPSPIFALEIIKIAINNKRDEKNHKKASFQFFLDLLIIKIKKEKKIKTKVI